MEVIFIFCFIIAVVGFGSARWLQGRWELPSVTSVPAEVLSRVAPRPALGAPQLRRQLSSKILRVKVVMPSGATVGGANILIRLSEPDADRANAHFGGLDALAADLATLYQRHALREGWSVPHGVRVQILTAPELRAGWVRVDPSPIYDSCDVDGDSGRVATGSTVSSEAATKSRTTDLRTEGTVREQPAHVIRLVGSGIDQEVTNVAVLGRSTASTIVLTNPLVSARHAVIRASVAGWSIEDTGSTNGTFVNGTRINPQEQHALRVGDIVRCGRTGPELRVAVMSGQTSPGD